MYGENGHQKTLGRKRRKTNLREQNQLLEQIILDERKKLKENGDLHHAIFQRLNFDVQEYSTGPVKY